MTPSARDSGAQPSQTVFNWRNQESVSVRGNFCNWRFQAKVAHFAYCPRHQVSCRSSSATNLRPQPRVKEAAMIPSRKTFSRLHANLVKLGFNGAAMNFRGKVHRDLA